MAHYLHTARGRQRNRARNRIYIISGLLIIAAVIAFIYGTFGRNKDEAPPSLTGANLEEETSPPLDVAPEPEPVVEPELLEIPPAPTVESNPQVGELIAEAMADLNAKPSRIIKARDGLNEALPMPMSEQQREFVKKQLSWLADKWLFNRSVFPGDRLCERYKVKVGDQLQTIGKQFKVPYEILAEINNITRPETLKAGESIKVIDGPFHARIYRSTFTMDLYLQNTFVRSFRVGLGKPGRETPTGLWCVQTGGKLIKPVWTDPDTSVTYHPESPDYPLGSRWIGLKGLEGEAVGRTGIAFHGTKDPDLMADGGSRGCIRLPNGDAVLLYNLLVPTFSHVEVVE
jgi:LysM repeat protein